MKQKNVFLQYGDGETVSEMKCLRITNMIRTRNLTLILLTATICSTALSASTISSNATNVSSFTPDIPEAGVPKELAQWRKTTYGNVRYRLHFNIPQTRSERVEGRITASLTLKSPEDIVLDFREPATGIHSVKVNGQTIRTEFLPMQENACTQPCCIMADEHIIIPAALTRSGENTVEIAFTADDQSLNRNDEFLYTLLVPDRARTLFPCFDQPDMKALYTLSLEVPADWKAVSNTYIEREELIHTGDAAEKNTATRKLITFSRTEPLSTYLFSFVAGEFYRKDYDDGRHRFSAYYRETDTAKTAQLDDIFAEVAASLEWLEEYTGVPYPFAKYDFIILPGFQYGGMEHTGATLYNDSRMFLSPNPTLGDRLSRTELIAHETAHMWFGDLVTMKWFDEVWTKEVFANHFAAWISEPLYPEVNHRLNRLRSFNTSALSEDRTEGTVSISQELPNLRYAGLVYGQIIYNKAPIMMEKLIEIMGRDTFRQGIQTYLKRYAYSNATWDDLVGVLDSLTSADLRGFSRAWVYEKGMPDLTFRITGKHRDSLTVTQSDPLGRGIIWPQSFGVTVSDGTQSVLVEVRMDAAEVTVPIMTGTTGTPSGTGLTGARYILPNTDGRGYGRFILPRESARWLLGHWSEIQDGTARFATLMNLQENYLAGLISARDWSRSILAGLEKETDQLTASSLSGFLSRTMDDLNGTDREAVEQRLWNLAHTHPEQPIRTILLRSLPSGLTTAALCDSLYAIWETQSEPLYSENNYTSLAWELAIRFPDRAGHILATQRARLTDPDRLRRFDYISRAVNPDEAARDTLFQSLMLAENRRIEPWTASVLSYLNHPLRESSSVRYIRPGLDILEEVQRTGDIFFPRNWAGALLGSHRSPEAWLEVQEFLQDNPDYPALLRNKILQAAYSLFRANTTVAVSTTPEDSIIYARTMQKLLPLAGRPSGEIMTAAAEALCGTPYKGGTLESTPEHLTVNLQETDCIILVEACTAMTLLLKDNPGGGIPPFEDFCTMLHSLRYRNGIISGYPSRLHYTSEWLLQASANGVLREVTQELGGIPLEQEFSFMSSHRDNYPQLRGNAGTAAAEQIRRTEERLDTAAAYFYIPAEKIREAEDNIQDGDIICIVSGTPGLDITHTAIACRKKDGTLHFIHASMREGKVVLETRSIEEYVKKGGIRVVRLN